MEDLIQALERRGIEVLETGRGYLGFEDYDEASQAYVFLRRDFPSLRFSVKADRVHVKGLTQSKSAGDYLAELEIRIASLELDAEIEALDEEILEERLSEDRMAIKRLSPAHARAISKGQKKSWKGNKSTRVRSMTKSRNKPNPNRKKNRLQRKKYKKHSYFFYPED